MSDNTAEQQLAASARKAALGIPSYRGYDAVNWLHLNETIKLLAADPVIAAGMAKALGLAEPEGIDG